MCILIYKEKSTKILKFRVTINCLNFVVWAVCNFYVLSSFKMRMYKFAGKFLRTFPHGLPL